MLHATQGALWVAAADALFLCRRAVLAHVTAARSYAFDVLTELTESRRTHPIIPMRIEAAPLGIAGQWRRATGIIHSALASFRNIETFQATAARQIDAANYELQLLIKDLGAVMPIPADGRALRAILAEAAKATTAPSAREKKALAA